MKRMKRIALEDFMKAAQVKVMPSSVFYFTGRSYFGFGYFCCNQNHQRRVSL
jgi:hypothetical protein